MKTDNRIMTGFPSLDKMLGGLRPGTLNVIAGAPGVGKTALAIEIAVNCAKDGHKVGIFSLEMSKDEITQRIVKYICDTSIDVSELPIYIDDETVINPAVILDKVNKLKADIIIVDYFQLISLPSNENRSGKEELKTIISVLKSIALELNIPIVLTSQMGRRWWNKNEESITFDEVCERTPYLNEYADSIVYVYRSLFGYLRQADEVSSLIVVKNAFGDTGTTHVKFDIEHLKFFDLQKNQTHEFQTYEVLDEEIRKKVMDGPLTAVPCASSHGIINAEKNYRCFITYDGVAPRNSEEFDVNKVLVVSDFIQFRGWVLMGMLKRCIRKDERDKEANNEMRRKVRVALKEHVRYLMDARAGWAEVLTGSELQKLFAKACAIHEVIDPDSLKKIYGEDVFVNPYSEFDYDSTYSPEYEPMWRRAYGYIEWKK